MPIDESVFVLTNPVIELRQYILHNGQRERFVEFFDHELSQAQEEAGISILGQFRNLDNPESFVWLRGFASMQDRRKALETFYEGKRWASLKNTARSLQESRDVLLLRPVTTGGGIVAHRRPSAANEQRQKSLVLLRLYSLHNLDDFPRFFERDISPELAACGSIPIGCMRSELSKNDYPASPVRETDDVFVCLSHFADETALEQHQRQLEQSVKWNDQIWPKLASRLVAEPIELRLSPTTTSVLR